MNVEIGPSLLIVTYRWSLTMNGYINRTIVTSIVTYHWFLFVFQMSWCSSDITRSKNLITNMFWHKYLTPHVGILLLLSCYVVPVTCMQWSPVLYISRAWYSNLWQDISSVWENISLLRGYHMGNHTHIYLLEDGSTVRTIEYLN